MIRPLSEGHHTIVAFAAGPVFPGGFAKITFHVTVVARQLRSHGSSDETR